MDTTWIIGNPEATQLSDQSHKAELVERDRAASTH